jgi:carotenoid cleavage dioxygenase-like enzyme
MNPFPFIREASGIQVKPQDMVGNLVRWTFDMNKPGDQIEEQIIGPGGDLPRIADKDALTDFEVGYYQRFDPKAGPPLLVGPVGAGFNTITRVELKSGNLSNYVPGPAMTVQEHVHIASKTPGHEGYLAFVVDKHDSRLSEAHVLEAGHIERGALAKIKLPLRLRCGVHGSWIRAEDF